MVDRVLGSSLSSATPSLAAPPLIPSTPIAKPGSAFSLPAQSQLHLAAQSLVPSIGAHDARKRDAHHVGAHGVLGHALVAGLDVHVGQQARPAQFARPAGLSRKRPRD